MENIFLQIDKIFEADEDTTPKWAKELLHEIKDIKKLLNNEKIEIPIMPKKQNTTNITDFIRGFRKMLKKDEKFVYLARELGINSTTVQEVCQEYATRRRQFKKRKLRWRGRKSLGSTVIWKGDTVNVGTLQTTFQQRDGSA